MAKYVNLNKINLYDNPHYVAPKDNESYKIERVVERVNMGLIGTLYILDEINNPIFKTGDLVYFTRHVKLEKGDFILYQEQGRYFLRRIIKFKNDFIFVAGDSEKAYHKITKQLVIAKAIARERDTKTFSLNNKSKKFMYRFKKVKLAFFRLKNKVIEYQQELLDESIELAKKKTIELNIKAKANQNIINNENIDIDLSNFVDPDAFIEEYLNGQI